MALRAEIAIIDDDENVVGIAKVPLYDSDVLPGIRGPFAENMVIDPDTGEVYKFTFQADLVGQIAPKREESRVPEVGDFVRVIGNNNPVHHNFKDGGLVEVDSILPDGDITATGTGRIGTTITQFVSRADYILE